MGGGYFPYITGNRPQKHKKHAILHTSQVNGGARAPPAPPGYATVYIGGPSYSAMRICIDFYNSRNLFIFQIM